MENQAVNTQRTKVAVMKNGVQTRAFYVKHLSLDDDQLLLGIKERYSLKTDAKALRWLIRKFSATI